MQFIGRCGKINRIEKITPVDFCHGGQFFDCGRDMTSVEDKTKWRYEIMSVISMKQLLEAGVHFGHQTRRWNPKMAEYIYTERNGIYIIDLQKTVKKVDEAYTAVSDIIRDGGEILFVGTKKQAQDSIKEEAERCGMYYVNQRWLGGMLTNFNTIKTRIARLKELEELQENGTFDVLTKKEVAALLHEKEKLENNLGGIKEMTRVPDVMFIVDPRKERIAIQEAHTLGIPIVAIVDTNCDPEEVDFVIPGNDDAIRAVKLIASKIADAVIESKQGEEMAGVETEEMEEEQIEKELLSKLKMNGLVNSASEVIALLDSSMDKYSDVIPISYNKDGSLTKNSSAVNTRQFEAVSTYVRNMIRRMGAEILNGNTQISPYRKGTETGCDYCEFREICGFDEKSLGFEYRRLQEMDSADILQQMEKEKEKWE